MSLTIHDLSGVESGMPKLYSKKAIEFLLILSISACFIGHGMWGLVSKPGWLPFFNIFGIHDELALKLMPFIGFFDISIGILILFVRAKPLILWAIFWTIFTALLRPLAGMGWGEFIERAGNYGPPIAFYWLIYFRKSSENEMSIISLHKIKNLLKVTCAMILFGHGLCLFYLQPNMVNNLLFLGMPNDTLKLIIFGIVEILLGVMTLMLRKGFNYLMILILALKLVTESVYPLRGVAFDIFETIERMGDFVIPILLILVNNWGKFLYSNTNQKMKLS